MSKIALAGAMIGLLCAGPAGWPALAAGGAPGARPLGRLGRRRRERVHAAQDRARPGHLRSGASLCQQFRGAPHRRAAELAGGRSQQSQSQALGDRGPEAGQRRVARRQGHVHPRSALLADRRARHAAQSGPALFRADPKEVWIIQEADHRVRHVLLDQPHSADPKPTWYGESVGHYEGGDTLVVDTIGMNDKTFVDSYRTPHTRRAARGGALQADRGRQGAGGQFHRRGSGRLQRTVVGEQALAARAGAARRGSLRREQRELFQLRCRAVAAGASGRISNAA